MRNSVAMVNATSSPWVGTIDSSSTSSNWAGAPRLLFDELKTAAVGESPRACRAQELGHRHVDVFAVARVEHHLLGIALDVAYAQVIAERRHRCRYRSGGDIAAFFTQSASSFHSGSLCVIQCLPPGWNSVPPASCASGIVNNRLFVGTPGTTTRVTASKFLRDSSSV